MKTNKTSGVFYAELDKKDAEILALREALDGVRWAEDYDPYRDEPAYCVCAFCGKERFAPEVHTPSCKIGKLFAGR